MYLFGYVGWTFKLQKILGIDILLPEFILADLFRTQNDIFISPKTKGINFTIFRKFEMTFP